MDVRNSTQITQNRSSNSLGTSNKSGRSAIDQISAEPTTADSLSFGSTTAEQLSDQPQDRPAENGAPLYQEQSGATDPVARLGVQGVVPISDLINYEPSIVEIQDNIEQLEAKLETASSSQQRMVIGFQLYLARRELQAEALKLIELELMERNGTPHLSGNAPEVPVGTASITRADLEVLAAGGEDDPLAIAARTVLNEPGGFESIAGEDKKFNIAFPFVGNITIPFTFPAEMTLGEIQAARLDAEKDIENATETNDGNADYEVPEGDDFTIGTSANEVEIGQVAFDAQQDAIEESIRSGEEVEFVNSVGETVAVTVTPIPGNGTASYSVVVREGAEANTFTVHSEIGAESTIGSIANIVDWGSSLAVAGPNIPAFPSVVNFRQEHHSSFAASVFGKNDTMNFYDGTVHINKATYVHEMGHLIGYKLNNKATEARPYSPAGWEAVLANTKEEVSQYQLDDPQEAFAEAFAAYVNAAEHGPEALAAFREAFPDRAAYIEEKILGTQKPVVVPEKTIRPLPPFLTPIATPWS